MPAIVVRKLPMEVHRKLRARARAHGRSTEAEVRAILAETVQSSPEGGLGTEIHRFAMRYGGLDLKIERDRRPPEAAEFK